MEPTLIRTPRQRQKRKGNQQTITYRNLTQIPARGQNSIDRIGRVGKVYRANAAVQRTWRMQRTSRTLRCLPVWRFGQGMARVTGLEPATSGVTGRRSNQLSYTRILIGDFRSRTVPAAAMRVTNAGLRQCQAMQNEDGENISLSLPGVGFTGNPILIAVVSVAGNFWPMSHSNALNRISREDSGTPRFQRRRKVRVRRLAYLLRSERQTTESTFCRGRRNIDALETEGVVGGDGIEPPTLSV